MTKLSARTVFEWYGMIQLPPAPVIVRGRRIKRFIERNVFMIFDNSAWVDL